MGFGTFLALFGVKALIIVIALVDLYFTRKSLANDRLAGVNDGDSQASTFPRERRDDAA